MGTIDSDGCSYGMMSWSLNYLLGSSAEIPVTLVRLVLIWSRWLRSSSSGIQFKYLTYQSCRSQTLTYISCPTVAFLYYL